MTYTNWLQDVFGMFLVHEFDSCLVSSLCWFRMVKQKKSYGADTQVTKFKQKSQIDF